MDKFSNKTNFSELLLFKNLLMEILYIEDDLVDQIALRRVLKHNKSIACRVASDLNEAEKLIQSGKFDIILSDYYLAGDTIEDVMSRFNHLPIFLLSGTENVQKIEQLYQNGLKGHFYKPFSKKDLSTIIKEEETIIQTIDHQVLANFSQPIVFDFTFLENIMRASLHLKKELIQIFIEMGTSEGLLLQQFLEESNWKMVGQTLHKIKSNLRMMGLNQLLIMANQLEMFCAESKNIDSVEQNLPQFLKRLKQAVEMAKKDF